MPDWLDRFTHALADRYRLERELGHGGMATVYLAQDLRHHRPVAVKALRPDTAVALGHERFLREIGIVAGLVHPHIVSLLDSGEAAGVLYYVMPFLPGESLRARVGREGELPVADTIRIVRGILAALEYAHGLGIIHRDIKPENILLAGPDAQVADFGIARAVAQAAGSNLTETGMAVGTAAYMAPEQAAGDPKVDHRADLYALGVLWYEMLAGANPFAGLTPQQQIAAHFTRVIEPLDALRPAVPRAIAEIVARCLEKRPADRWQHASEITRRLDAFLAGASGATVLRAEPEPLLKSFRLTEELLGRLAGGFDPRMPGDTISYLDNGTISDVLVCYLPRWSIDPEEYSGLLRKTRYRAIAPALFGFDGGRRYRPSLPVADHFVLLGGLLHEVARATEARHVVLVGFSTGADLVLRMAAADPAQIGTRIDGALSLGGNISRETAFLSAVLAEMGDAAKEDDALPFLRRVGNSQPTLQDWLDVSEYLLRMVRRFRSDFPVLRDFAAGIAGPLEVGGPATFVGWYQAAARNGRRLRCVFEDNSIYRDLVRRLQLGSKDKNLLGADYQPGSIVVEPGTGHFDLEAAELVERHLEQLVEGLVRRPPSPPASPQSP